MNLSFIVIENAEIDQYIVRELVRKVTNEAIVYEFFAAEAALEHITADLVPEAGRRIILLDLMMPGMSGREFIKVFGTLSKEIRDKYQIAIITSSMNKAELQRLSKHQDVASAVEKPLTREKFKILLEQLGGVTNRKEI